MKLIWKPSVYVVGCTQMDHSELSRYLADNGYGDWSTYYTYEPQSLVEVAGRVCYQSWKKGRPHDEYIKHIIESAHGSVLEHAVFNLLITGVSRSLTHELIRHRAGMGFSELSQRYVDCSDVGFVVPPAIPKNEYAPGTLGLFQSSSRRSLEAYSDLSEWLIESAPKDLSETDRRKWARQAARSVLPNCTETQIFVTANARALRNFLEQRSSQHADAEMRRLSNYIYEAVKIKAPLFFADYTKTPLEDGTFELSTPNRKV